jgi:hypothetical protein
VSKNHQDKFNFFVEADIKKGKDENGKDIVWIDGIASSSSVSDSDGETLFPSGYNLQPFLESGLVNYNHQGSKDSNANVGVPVEAKVVNSGKDLYVKCMLWPCSQTTGIVTAYDAFQKYDIARKVGFSIEGKATYKDPLNPKRILKADITGLAITFSPKNKNTLMNIIKGEYETAFIDLNEDEEKDEKEKAIDTAAIAPATPESVEHNKKDISNKKISNFGELLKKSDIYIQIAKSFPQNSIAEQKSIYNLVVQVNSKFFKMENMVSPEALTKAFDLINEATALVKGEQPKNLENKPNDADTIMKGEDAVDFDNEDVKKALDTARVLVKAGMEKEAGCETLVKGGIESTVAQASWEKAVSEMQAQQNGGSPEAQAAPLFKSEEVTALVTEEIKKSVEPLNGSINKVNEVISKGFEGFGTILKSLQESNQALTEQNTLLNQRLDKLESTPMGRKSAANVQAVEKFQKSQDNGVIQSDINTYNVTSKEDLNRLAERLVDEHKNAIEKGKKDDANLFEGAINQIECYGKVPEFAYRKLAQLGIRLTAPSA